MRKQALVGFVSAGLLGSAMLFTANVAPSAATLASAGLAISRQAPDRPEPHLDLLDPSRPSPGWLKEHQQLVALAKQGGIDLCFLGDSITSGWASEPGIEVWNREFGAWRPANFGVNGDHTQHVLWRLQHGELDGLSPKVFVVMIGTNNSGWCSSQETAAGIRAIVNNLQAARPDAKILLLGIFPRGSGPNDTKRKINDGANAILAHTYGPSDAGNVRYLDIGEQFMDADGKLRDGVMPDLLHPGAKGYQIWADAIRPTLTEWLGNPAGNVTD